MTLLQLDSQSRRPLLSFAIPTYNFGKFIGETIKSIIEGATTFKQDHYEIVILDGGSDDETDKVISELTQQYRNIRYKKNAARGGIDRDLNEVAGMAEGKYIWLFSADDLLVSGWDQHVACLLEMQKDIYLVPAELCDYSMGHLRNNPIFCTTGNKYLEFSFDGTSKTINAYLHRANTLEALFSFMSAVIVKADLWRALKERPDYYGSCWAHCTRLLPSLFQKTTLVYANKYLIKKRGGNDSFMENGFVSRIGIAVDGWGRIIHEFFSNHEHQEQLFKALRKDMPILLFVYAKISAKDRLEIIRLNTMSHALYSEWSATRRSKIYYLLYSLVPASATLNRILEPYLPFLIRLRHKLRALISGIK